MGFEKKIVCHFGHFPCSPNDPNLDFLAKWHHFVPNTTVKQSIFCIGFPDRPPAKMTVNRNGLCISKSDFPLFNQNRENATLLMVSC